MVRIWRKGPAIPARGQIHFDHTDHEVRGLATTLLGVLVGAERIPHSGCGPSECCHSAL